MLERKLGLAAFMDVAGFVGRGQVTAVAVGTGLETWLVADGPWRLMRFPGGNPIVLPLPAEASGTTRVRILGKEAFALTCGDGVVRVVDPAGVVTRVLNDDERAAVEGRWNPLPNVRLPDAMRGCTVAQGHALSGDAEPGCFTLSVVGHRALQPVARLRVTVEDGAPLSGLNDLRAGVWVFVRGTRVYRLSVADLLNVA